MSTLAVLILFVAVFALMEMRVWAARASQQETLQRQQLVITRGETEALILAGESAIAAQNWEEASRPLEKAIVKMGSEEAFADLRKRTDTLLAEVNSKLADQAERRRERDKYQQFFKLRDDALFHATLCTGRDIPTNVKATETAARAGLATFQVKIDSPEGPALGHFENTEQGKEIRESCYELLLLLAEAVGFDLPNQQPAEQHRQRTEALRILGRAANLGVTTQAFHLYRARYLAALGR